MKNDNQPFTPAELGRAQLTALIEAGKLLNWERAALRELAQGGGVSKETGHDQPSGSPDPAAGI